MSKLPVISGLELIKYLSKKGFEPARQSKHVVMRGNNRRPFPVPMHPELDRGTLLGILEQADISRDEFIRDWYG